MTEETSAPAPQSTPPTPAAPEPSVAEVTTKLKALFPALFAGGAKPFKLKIQADIQARAPGEFSKGALSAFFRRHTGSTSYLIALTRAPHRFDLDGQPAGEIAEEHKQAAVAELARRRANQQAREQVEDEQRHNRATLLRDYERTTLTRANFCALKGLPEAELDGILAIAREEAAQRPLHPAAQRPARHPSGRPADDRRRPDRPQSPKPQRPPRP
jgi:ProP effector